MAGRARGRTSAVHRNGEPGAASSLRTGTCSGSQRGRPEDTAVRRLATDQGRAVNTSHTLPSPHRPGEPLCGIQRADCSPTHVASERSSRTVSAADSYFIRPGCDARWILSAIPGFASLGSGSHSYRPGIAESPWAAASTRSPVTPYTSS